MYITFITKLVDRLLQDGADFVTKQDKSQLIFTCSKSAIETTLEESVEYVQSYRSGGDGADFVRRQDKYYKVMQNSITTAHNQQNQ